MAEAKKELGQEVDLSGDHESFQSLTSCYRYELLVHCYRMLGSLEDAEDALQETLLRAWRHLDSLKTPTALRAWLYRIATNVILDMLDGSKIRLLPTVTHPPAGAEDELLAPLDEPLWIDPLPEAYLDEYQSDPETRYEALENVSLAFLVVLQQLPGRQRAILLLCDVLEWKAQEAADALNITVAAVNSALQRARATLKKHQSSLTVSGIQAKITHEGTDLLNRYIQAWEAADVSSLMALLREDAILTMPPYSLWIQGREAIGSFLERMAFAGKVPGQFRMVTTRANGAPAFALYQREEAGRYSLVALHILTLVNEKIAQIDDFLAVNTPLFSRLHLPFPD